VKSEPEGDGTGAPGVAAGTRLAFGPGTRRLGPGLLSGGNPWRLLRLTAGGDRWIDRWRVGQTVPDAGGARRLATRLVDTGLAWSRPVADREVPVTVVVPCRDRAAGLAATLQALDPDVETVVIDDGSCAPAETADVAARRPRTRVIQRAARGGPAAARNDGWRRGAPDAELIAFLDTECIPPPGWIAELAGHFRDPRIGAVAPRIEAYGLPGGTPWLQAYDAVRSPLDLGATPAAVRPRSTVPFVPSTALMVRRAALVALGGFDEQLLTGEDVDFVWRLDRDGWQVRYDPSVVVRHPVRPDLPAWLAQRAGYGRSAAPLASRHGTAVAPLSISRSQAAAWLLVGLGHPVGAAAVAMAASRRLATRAVAGEARPSAEITRLARQAHLRAGLGIADAVRRAWWPLALATAVASRRVRPALAAVVLVAPLIEWQQRRPAIRPTRWLALRLADDIAYGTGVWVGVWRERRARCLLPHLF
jgi:mycofactocin system glycosyltransferase